MALYVYITPECEKEARKHNRHAEMIRLKEKVEEAQSKSHLDHFPPPYLKKRFDRQIRLLADYRTRKINDEEHVVVSFIRIYVRSSKEYAAFLDDSIGFGKKFLAPLVDNEKVDEYLREQLRENPVPAKAPPSEHENHVLYRFLGGQSEGGSVDEFVCESERWVRSVQEKKIEPLLLHIYETLPGLIGGQQGSRRVAVRNHKIVCRWLPGLEKLFLAGIAESEEDLCSIEQTYSELLNAPDGDVPEELLLRSSMRTYTALLLADEDGWLGVQKDSESNLALSPEETAVLESVHDHKSGFPVFINGRAGSGKSTILYYLFADYLNLYLELSEEGTDLQPPILFSCSDDLTRRAHDTVSNLIRCNPRWRNEDGGIPDVPASCFQEFHTYLLSLVPEADKPKFNDDGYIDYAKFRRLWDKQFGHEPQMIKEAGPDLSWHIIRTYIKGTSPEDLLEPEEYTHLPKKQKSVSRKAFETVYLKVWEAWYKDLCEQENHWDDQDLARFVFGEKLVKSEVPAVFCDEAQDFTRVELEILFRLCVFVDRKLDDHSAISRVPYAFAGDPFQTLNPTGFRWDAIQASFHDKLTETLCESIPRDVEINYQELNLNYRSTKNVVKFCNLIQSMRASLFDLPNLRPQQTWQFENSSPLPVWFDRDNRPLWETLQQESDITIIVPCALNEEVEFVARDEALRKLVRLDDKNVPQNVLSPARAKGLEFGRVVLYAFAENATHDLLNILDEDEYDQDERLPFEYFINQLYVAASRPKRRLFIIDSQKGRDQLWRVTSDEVKQKLWGRIHDGAAIWEEEVGGFIDGRKESWSEDRGDPEENALRYEQQGVANRDPYLLRSAALSYENIGKKELAVICKAKALRLEQQYQEAGHCFREVGDVEEALNCYWQEGLGASTSIIELQHPQVINRIEYKLVHTLSDPVPVAVMNQLEMLCQHEREVDGFAMRLQLERPFSDAVWKMVEFFLGCKEQGDLKRVTGYVENLTSIGMSEKHQLFASLYYAQGEMELAVEHWEKDPKLQNSPEYRKAKSTQLAHLYEADPRVELSQTDAVSVSSYFTGQGRYELAIQPLAIKGAVSDLIQALSKVPMACPVIPELVKELVDVLIRRSEWSTVVDIAFTSTGSQPGSSVKAIASILVQHSSSVLVAVVNACSDSEELVRLDTGMLQRYSDYFQKVLCRSGEWKKHLLLELAGSSIERAGRQKDILPFYEKVWEDAYFDSRQKDFARARWIVTKEKQAAREEDNRQRSNASKHMNEAFELRREIGALDEKLPEYPVITKQMKDWSPPELSAPETKVVKEHKSVDETVSDSASRPSVAVSDTIEDETASGDTEIESAPSSLGERKNTTVLLGNIRLEFSPVLGRVNLTHVKSMDQASFRVSKRRFTSDDVQFSDEGSGVFNCQNWQLNCSVTDQGESTTVTVAPADSGVSVTLNFPAKISPGD